MKLSRKDFLLGTLGLVAVGAVATSGCGPGGNNPPDGGNGNDGGDDPSCLDNGTSAAIEGNHGHTLSVSEEDVAAGVEKIYDIRGSSAHAHSVTVTAANFATLAGNNPVTVSSTSGAGHTHSVTVTCV